jgi:hypothetical protein
MLATVIGIAAHAEPALAQSAIIYGSIGNFDISNDTGLVCHGFEIDIDGLTKADIPYSFSTERYGAPTVTDYAGGVSVRWQSPVDPATGACAERTVQHTVPWFPGQCYQWTGPASDLPGRRLRALRYERCRKPHARRRALAL